ncbi:uracil-DNA glycosylase family protein [Pelagibacterium xiamenense]|uniref:uracil-DNA glycosylase family protein n=1 Tax=Pelagibacterium xiamenense TaxID=2901140 RepID=UPI001E462073|nr:uracil-DNA glycosylase family protein [Pelagibacterium xiamenense]MCD7059373.1 uracil-DNA glycosylase family protein [Pelagibacterium xiamenense]
MTSDGLQALHDEIRGCAICAAELPLGPRPVVQVGNTAKVLIIGQAPGRKVHESGVPWNDQSGQRLRRWLGIAAEDFYDNGKIALVPMGFCYPGVAPRGGDLPPRPICAPTWHRRLFDAMPDIELTVLVGLYAQRAYLTGAGRLGANVAAFADHLPRLCPLPHPSWRVVGWMRRNPWFERDVLPALRARVAVCLGRK